MTPRQIYDALSVPESCFLGKRVFKKLFLEHGELRPADKKALSRDVGNVVWQYTLKPGTIAVQSYADEEREYLEIAILEVELSDRKSAQRIGEVVHRTIPYPVVLVLADEAGCSLSLAAKRFSRSKTGRVVAEEQTATPWLEEEHLNGEQRRFLDSLSLRLLPQSHFLELYEALLQRVLTLQGAEAGGSFRLDPGRTIEQQRADLNQIRHLEQETREVRSAIRSENAFARKVELNTRLKNLEDQHRTLVERI